MGKRNFDQERTQAQPIAERVSTWLQELGIQHDPIDWQRAGMLAVAKAGENEFGSMIALERSTRERLLDEVRRTMARAIAYEYLSTKQGNHVLQFSDFVLERGDISWLTEVTLDFDEARYVLVTERLRSAPGTPSGIQRTYALYQAKQSPLCDAPECTRNWYVRKVTQKHYCIHLCQQHEELDPDQTFEQVKPWLVLGEEQ